MDQEKLKDIVKILIREVAELKAWREGKPDDGWHEENSLLEIAGLKEEEE